MVVRGGDARQLLVAIESLVVAAQRQVGVSMHPPHVKRALHADLEATRAHVPSAHECCCMVEAIVLRHQPAWFTERWPRTFGTVAMAVG